MSRLRAETMPSDTEPPRPKGLPIASTQSPTLSLSELPKLTAVSGLSGLTRSTAISVLASRPTSSALRLVPSVKTTVDVLGLLDHVIVGDDDAGGIDDEAGALRIDRPRLGRRPPGRWRLKKSSNKSRNGTSGGKSGICRLRAARDLLCRGNRRRLPATAFRPDQRPSEAVEVAALAPGASAPIRHRPRMPAAPPRRRPESVSPFRS